MLATHAFPFQYPNAALSISAGHEAKAMHCQSIQQEGQRKRILQGALCLLKSGSYLPFPSLPPLAKAAVAPAQMQVSCLPGFQRPAYLHPQPVSVLPELRAIARGTPCCKKCVLPWYPAATFPRWQRPQLPAPLLQGQCSAAILNWWVISLPRCSLSSAPSPALLCPPKLRKHSKKNTLL